MTKLRKILQKRNNMKNIANASRGIAMLSNEGASRCKALLEKYQNCRLILGEMLRSKEKKESLTILLVDDKPFGRKKMKTIYYDYVIGQSAKDQSNYIGKIGSLNEFKNRLRQFKNYHLKFVIFDNNKYITIENQGKVEKSHYLCEHDGESIINNINNNITEEYAYYYNQYLEEKARGQFMTSAKDSANKAVDKYNYKLRRCMESIDEENIISNNNRRRE